MNSGAVLKEKRGVYSAVLNLAENSLLAVTFKPGQHLLCLDPETLMEQKAHQFNLNK